MSEYFIECLCGACGQTFELLDGDMLPRHAARLDPFSECNGSLRSACKPVSIEIGLLFLDEVDRHSTPSLDEACSSLEDVEAVRDLFFEKNGRALLLELRERRHALLKCRQDRERLARRINKLLTLLPTELRHDVINSA